MPIVIPTETDQDVSMLKTQGAQAILASLKAFVKKHRSELASTGAGAQTVAERNQLAMLVEIFYLFVKALETPYPPSLFSAGLSYLCGPTEYTKKGAVVIHRATNEIIPRAIEVIRGVALTEAVQQFLCVVLKHLIALKLGEEARQGAINRGDAGTTDRMAHDVLQKQEPRMDFTRVADLLARPLIEALRAKLSESQQHVAGMGAVSCATP